MSNQFGIRSLAQSSVVSATSSIELFNRPRAEDRLSMSMIANVRAWEQLAKSILLKKGESIYIDRNKTISASKAIRLLDSKFNLISPGENQTIQQIISLRDEATHTDLNIVPDDLAAHLLYFSLKSYKELLSKFYPKYAKKIDANFISINFNPTYTYGARVKSILSSKKRLKNNRLAFLLERGLHNANFETQFTEGDWAKKIRGLRRRRVTKSALFLKKYSDEHDNVMFITVEAPSKYGKAEVTLSKGRHGASTKISVVSSDPEDTHPYLTKELGNEVGIGLNKTVRIINILKLKGNKDYHLSIRSSKSGSVQRYSKLALEKIKEYLKENKYDS